MSELKTEEHIRADCMMPVREAERLKHIEHAAREFLAASPNDGDSLNATSREVALGKLCAALAREE